MPLSLSAEKRSIKELFYNDKIYIVPSYQRPYIWGQEECLTMLGDISSAFNQNEDYFLGNIVLAKSDEDDDTLHIIDGQQRLITIWMCMKIFSVLLSCENKYGKLLEVDQWGVNGGLKTKVVSEIFEKDDGKVLSGIWKMSIANIEDLFSEYKKNNRRYIQSGDHITSNFLLLYGWFKELFERIGESKSVGLSTFFIKRVFVLHIELYAKTMDEACTRALTIFETINNRGQNLSDADIFKARLFLKAQSVGKESEFLESWRELKNISTSLSIEIDDLFRYYYHIIRGERRIVRPERSLRDFFTEEDSPLMRLDFESFISKLKHIAHILIKLEDSIYSCSEIAKWLQILSLYSNKYPRYAVVAFVYRNGFDEGPLIKLLKSLIKLCYFPGSTSSNVKHDIYVLIVSIMTGLVINVKPYTDVTVEAFYNTGVLRNGYVLLAHYIDNPTQVYTKFAFKRFFTQEKETREELQLGKDDWEKLLRSLGNTEVHPLGMYNSKNSAAYSLESDKKALYKYVLNRDLVIKKALVDFLKGA